MVGQYGAAWVRGAQGLDDPRGRGYLKVAASPKHLTGYSIDTGEPGGWDDPDGPILTGRSTDCFQSREAATQAAWALVC